jgi:hypothetical protein
VTDLPQAVCDQHRVILDLADDMLEKYESLPLSGRSVVKAVDALVAAESRHESAEAVFLWPVVRDVMPEYAELRAAVQAQERRARFHLHRLHKQAREPDSAALAVRIVRQLASHVAFEENEILAALGPRLDRDVSFRLARKYVTICERGPTRPHPLTPAIPGLLRMSAPLVARTDWVRDLLRLR